ncbi:MAG: membrane protein insertase YidC [Actinomycetia bacterium]|nr:membrane protein insertase YidC [Actinomycetes bacterium]
MQSLIAFTIPGLEWLSEGFAYALKFLYDLTGNFGIAIILITVGMRLVLLPLTIKQTKSMIAMQRLQPQLKEIQKKYKDDREKQGQAMMKLYKDNKVSPLGGCLPLILQLPIIFAIFDVLHNLSNAESVAVKIIGTNTNFVFLSMDMTLTGSRLWTGGHYVQVIILILLTVATGYVSAKMMTTDPKQAKMMAMMPVLMGVFAWILPAGVTVYIIVTNILTFAQQYVQLERDGSYDEKRAEMAKSRESLIWYKKLNLKSLDIGSNALIALNIKSKSEQEKQKVKKPQAGEAKTKKPQGGAEKKPAASKKSSGQKKPAASTKKGPQAQKKGPQGKNLTGGKPATKKATEKQYPAKRKSKGKKK